MIRKLFAKFNRSLAERVGASRKKLQVPIKVWFEPDRHTDKLKLPLENLSVSGETVDLSTSGIAFIVSSIRIKENYLVGEGRTLNVELDLPEGKVQMQIVGQRYEQVGQHISTARFRIGAKIVRITPENQEAYEYFLRYGNKHKKGSLALGIDEG
jgi:PilZ domain